ncbi:MAG: DUF1844 domain-containing protein [Deltaproteobacteria bacterium]|nr:DUF1844 domain-containing protein [Deltaproteobacteria bacterium]
MDQEDKGFTVVDRRAFAEDGAAREEEPERKTSPSGGEAEAPGPQTAAEPSEPAPRAQAEKGRPQEDYVLPPVDFGALILSLAHSAMMHLGALPDPYGQELAPNPALARHTIDTIALLKEKTKGNLDPDEQRLVDNTLTELRLAYVSLTS